MRPLQRHRREPLHQHTLSIVGVGLLLALGCSPSPAPKPTVLAPSSTNTAGHRAATAPADRTRPATTAALPPPRVVQSAVRFARRDADLGLEHTYLNGARGQLLMVESIGGGAGWLDYDRDGTLDAYLTQGGDPVVGNRPHDRLFRQLPDGRFEPVEPLSGIDREDGYGQGVAIGDYDDDGFPDIYVTNCGPNAFFRNLGDGTFLEVAGSLSIDDRRWSSSAAWGDLDQDGDLDLYVCNYLKFDPANPLKCEKDGLPALCHPRQIDAWPDECFENLGDGTFRPVSREWGLYGDQNKGLGVVIADLTNDGRPDVFVANDTTPNFLFVQHGPGQFVESAIRLGTGLSGDGAMQANMGIAVGDYDRNGWLDLYITHFTIEGNTLYQNLGQFGFHDVTGRTGILKATSPKLGFGTVMEDFDQNGTPELIAANGHIDERNADGEGYEQRPQLLSYVPERWEDISADSGDYFHHKYVGRAIATGDYDRDGALDLLVAHQNSPTALLHNESQHGHWLRFDFRGWRSNRFGIGARVVLKLPEGALMKELAGGTSFCASHEPQVTFGLGPFTGPVEAEIRWPSGVVQTVSVDQVDQRITVVEPRE